MFLLHDMLEQMVEITTLNLLEHRDDDGSCAVRTHTFAHNYLPAINDMWAKKEMAGELIIQDDYLLLFNKMK